MAALGAVLMIPTLSISAEDTGSRPIPNPASTVAFDTILVPKGTAVVVKTTQGYNSYSAKTGAKIRYEVAQDVIVAGHVIAKAGDTAEGAFQEAQAGESGFYGIGYKAANMRLSVDEVYNFCADTIHVDFDRSEYRRRQGIFGSNRDVQVTKGQLYVATTDRPQKVCGEATIATPAPLPANAIRSADH